MKPLGDVRIIAVEQYGAGPFGSLQLADLGAEVIKIEDPAAGGDVGRFVPPYQRDNESLFFETFNRNKKSLDLDLTSKAGRAVFLDLVRVSDAVFSNLRGDVPERLAIRYSDLKGANKSIVCCSLSGFGMTGPRSAEPAYDYILQALAGWMSLTGEPGGPPTKTGLSLVDFSGGLVAATALLAGIHAARRDGVGMDCDLSLYDVALSLLTYLATWHLTTGYSPQRTVHSAHPSLVPFQNFQTADGWIVVGCAKERFWRRLTEVVGRPELASDERFRDFKARSANAPQLLPILMDIFRSRRSDYWLETLRRGGVPSAPIRTLDEALVDPHTTARAMLIETEHPRFGTVRQVRSAVRVGEPIPGHRRAPERNQNKDEILRGLLGYSAERVVHFEQAGAFGSERAEQANAR